MKIAFIADFFSNEIVGGAENNDSVLFDYLSKIYEVQKINSKNATIENLKQYDFFIVSNFVFLSQNCKDFIETQEYIIYEHDHKYVSTRDPSVFVDFEIPSSKIVNKDFYINAKFVVVLSEICKEVIEKNLNLKNVVNIGTSLWSDQQLDILSKNIHNSKQESLCVLKSNNKVKNQDKAEFWCNKNNKQYSLVGSNNYEEFIKQLSSHKGLVFIPSVLETFSRLACEAKILDLDLMTNKRLLGFASETSFSMRGEELLKETKKRISSALQKFNECIQAKKHRPYIAILSLWKRGQWLEEQLDCLENQSTKPEEIWLCHGLNEDNKHFLSSDLMKRFDKVKILEDGGSIFSRFEMAKEYDGYYLVIDDDMFPSREYISNCFKFLNHYDEAIICSSGRKFEGTTYFPNKMFGSIKFSNSIEVDIGTNGWFLSYESIKQMNDNHDKSYNNGEDIAISYLNRQNREVKSFVIKQNNFINSDIYRHKRGVGEEALSHSSNHKEFYKQRNEILYNYMVKTFLFFNYYNKKVYLKSLSHKDHQVKSWKQSEFYEKRLLEKIKNYNLSGNYLDIGANVGNHSIYFSLFCKSTTVYSYEPHPQIFNVLSNNIKKNDISNIQAINCGLGSKEEKLKMSKIDLKNCGSTKIEQNGEETVLVKTLDSFNLDNIVVMKIDVEGFEKEVLLGSIKTIKKNYPMIIIESSNQKQFKKISDFLYPLGYRTDGINYANTPTFIWIKKV